MVLLPNCAGVDCVASAVSDVCNDVIVTCNHYTLFLSWEPEARFMFHHFVCIVRDVSWSIE